MIENRAALPTAWTTAKPIRARMRRIAWALIAYAIVPLITHAALYAAHMSPVAVKLELRQLGPVTRFIAPALYTALWSYSRVRRPTLRVRGRCGLSACSQVARSGPEPACVAARYGRKLYPALVEATPGSAPAGQ